MLGLRDVYADLATLRGLAQAFDDANLAFLAHFSAVEHPGNTVMVGETPVQRRGRAGRGGDGAGEGLVALTQAGEVQRQRLAADRQADAMERMADAAEAQAYRVDRIGRSVAGIATSLRAVTRYLETLTDDPLISDSEGASGGA